MKKILSTLNDEQLEAVVYTERPIRIIAGAGSGKTRVITIKIAYLIQELGLKPYRILAMTFTNKAANEMKSRVSDLIPNLEQSPFISTFHKFGVVFLRQEHKSANLSNNFTIIDRDDQKKIITEVYKTMDIDYRKNKLIDKTISKISLWKSSNTDWEEAYENQNTTELRNMAKVFREYVQVCKNEQNIDFDDILLKTHYVLKNNLEIREKWQNKFDYIMVDEFQDTNNIQAEIVRWLLRDENSITVVGDPDQNIYSWRGAKLKIIMDFEKNYKNSKTIVLNKNYRSTQNILNLANYLISKNKNRFEKESIGHKKEGEKVSVKEITNKSFEARFIALKIKELIKEHNYKYSDFFILYRISAWSKDLETALNNEKIPYTLLSGTQFKDRKIIKDVNSVLRFVTTKNNLDAERFLGLIPKIGKVTINKLLNLSLELSTSLFDFLISYREEVLKITKHLDDIVPVLKEFNSKIIDNPDVYKFTKSLINKLGILKNYDSKTKEDLDALQNLAIYYEQMSNFDKYFTAEQYGQENKILAFIQEETMGNIEINEETPNKVSLMTVHASKGLENKVVFLAGMNQGIFPSQRSYYSPEQLEEERRAFYVAITRAEEQLFISYVQGEYSFLTSGELSRSKFIEELNPELFTYERNIFFHTPNDMTSQKYNNIQDSVPKEKKYEHSYKENDVVNHILYGDGIIKKLMDAFLTIAFEDPKYGVKQIPINSSAISIKN